MAKGTSTNLNVVPRAPEHSRATRRLRRAGRVPGVLYGRGGDPLPFSVDERELRHALAGAGAVLDVSVEGKSSPAVVKDTQIHPVRGEVIHIDLIRVDLNQAIHALVTLHIHGAEDAPGVKEGGVLEQVVRELNVEALPGDIPEAIEHDVSGMELMATEYLSAVTVPEGVTLLDDLEETVIATITPPRGTEEPEEGIEEETEVVGEGAGAAEGEAAEAGEVPAEAGEGEQAGGE